MAQEHDTKDKSSHLEPHPPDVPDPSPLIPDEKEYPVPSEKIEPDEPWPRK